MLASTFLVSSTVKALSSTVSAGSRVCTCVCIYVCMYEYIYVCMYILMYLCICVYVFIYTGCPRRKGPNFGRLILRSTYTDKTQNTYIQSSMVTEILAREKCGCLLCLRTVVCPWRHTSHMYLPSTRNPAVAVGCDRQSVDCVWGANTRFVFVIAGQWFG